MQDAQFLSPQQLLLTTLVVKIATLSAPKPM